MIHLNFWGLKMDHYEYISKQSEENYRRLTGVKRATFEKMLEVLREADAKKRLRRGRRPTLSLENRLLMTLKYLREYVTFASLGAFFGLNESTAIRIVHWVEDTLSGSADFRLPSKRALLEPDISYEVFVVDATETAIERPKRPRGKKES
jgi:hypothetical protein